MYAITNDSDGMTCSQQAMSHVPAGAVGCFKMPAGRAMSLAPNAAGELRIAHGQVWVTFTDAALDSSARGGDHFLQAGDVLHLACGQKVVMEVSGTRLASTENTPAYFSWEPDAILSQTVRARQLQYAYVGVRQPAQDLAVALYQMGGALGRLAQGLADYVLRALVHKPCKP